MKTRMKWTWDRYKEKGQALTLTTQIEHYSVSTGGGLDENGNGDDDYVTIVVHDPTNTVVYEAMTDTKADAVKAHVFACRQAESFILAERRAAFVEKESNRVCKILQAIEIHIEDTDTMISASMSRAALKKFMKMSQTLSAIYYSGDVNDHTREHARKLIKRLNIQVGKILDDASGSWYNELKGLR